MEGRESRSCTRVQSVNQSRRVGDGWEGDGWEGGWERGMRAGLQEVTSYLGECHLKGTSDSFNLHSRGDAYV